MNTSKMSNYAMLLRIRDLLTEAKSLLCMLEGNLNKAQIPMTNETLDGSERLRVKYLASHTTRFKAEIDLFGKIASQGKSVSLTLRKLQARRIDLVRRLRMAFPPHKQLPPELLAKVFVHSLGPKGVEIPALSTSVPWNLIRVCSAWRHIALGETRLWSQIQVNWWEVETRQTLEQVINRARQSPLDFTASFYENRRASVQRFINEAIVPYAPRFKKLSLRTSPALMKHFLSLEGDSLEAFDAHCSYPIDLPGSDPSFFNQAPAFRRLTLHGMMLAPAVGHALLVHCTSLVECTLDVGNRTSSEGFASQLAAHERNSIMLPFLREFTIIIKALTSYAQFLEPFILPSLDRLSLEFGTEIERCPSPSVLVGLINRSNCPLTHLRIRNSGNMDLEPILEVVPLLTNVSTNDALLSTSAAQRIRSGELLPCLQSIECSLESVNVKDIAGLVQARWVTKACRSSVRGDLRSLCFHTLSYSSYHCGVRLLLWLKDLARALGLQDRDVSLSLERWVAVSLLPASTDDGGNRVVWRVCRIYAEIVTMKIPFAYYVACSLRFLFLAESSGGGDSDSVE